MPSGLSPNELKVLSALYSIGPLSRADLARRLEFTRSTTGILIQSLIQDGLVRDKESEAGTDIEGGLRVGRPGILVEIDGARLVFMGAYIGVNAIRLTCIDLAGKALAKLVEPFDGTGSIPPLAVKTLAGMISKAREILGPQVRVLGLNIAVPGFAAGSNPKYHAAILGWHDVDIVRLADTELGGEFPILVENDANAIALAEANRAGNEAEHQQILVVLIENGVGGGIISGGKLYRGQLNGAGEIGHMPIGSEGYTFDAQRPGRFETYVGKDALLARYAYISGTRSSFEDYLDALNKEDANALRTARDWGHWLTRGLAVLATILQPSRIVLAGSVSAVFPIVKAHVEAGLVAALIDGYPVPALEYSSIGADGPASGAALVLHQFALSGDDRFPLRLSLFGNQVEGSSHAKQG